jgi:putative transposase
VIHRNMRIFSIKKNVSLRVCVINPYKPEVAVADMNEVAGRANVKAPSIMSNEEIYELIESPDYQVGVYKLPVEISHSDKRLITDGHEKWITKRDQRFDAIKTLTEAEVIQEYLFGDGIGQKIKYLAEQEKLRKEKELSLPLDLRQGGPYRTSPGAYYNILNKYIVFGCQKNALLPVGLKNVGSNYFIPEVPDENNIKRGRGGKDNSNCKSQSRGITVKDKLNIVAAYKDYKKNHKKFTPTKIEAHYRKLFDRIITKIPTEMGERVLIDIVSDEDSISEFQFLYHYRNLITRQDLLKSLHGEVAFEKDFADKQGTSRDGVIGPTFRYEIDATILDIYVRYPYDSSGQFSMGRPVLYLVIDVYTTVIVGMYIGFHGPDWTGASEALLNAFENKKEFATKFGVVLSDDDWPCNHIPIELTIDNGVEYSLGHLSGMLDADIGIESVNLVAVFRGDAKGVVERKFGVINGFIHFEPGAVIDLRREDAHPSNDALWDLHTLQAAIIEEIVYHNNNEDRLHFHNFDMSFAGEGVTPMDIWKATINEEMNGGRPANPDEFHEHQWAFLPEITVTVRHDGVYFKGVAYHSDYAKKAGWYARAKHHKKFYLTFKRTLTTGDYLLYQTDDGEIVLFYLKTSGQPHRFEHQPWEVIEHRKDQESGIRHLLRLQQRLAKLKKDTKIDDLREMNLKEIENLVKSSTKSFQKGVKTRAENQKEIEKAIIALRIAEQYSGGLVAFTTKDAYDIDGDLYAAE